MREQINSESYNEFIARIYGNENVGMRLCRYITFVVTEDCCLKCTYCYEKHKTNKRMDFETGKQIVDCLFDMYEKDSNDGFINKDTKAIILDFIGGEPMLEVELIEDICDYFWNKALELHHPWADFFKISITSNGIPYFKKEAQRFIQKYRERLSLTITIDGDKSMHDQCRVYPDGRGSWDDAWAAEIDMNKKFGIVNPGTKVTISPDNLNCLHETIGFFVSNGYKEIYANTIFEYKWTVKEAREFYHQLIKIADDYFLKNYDENNQVYCSLFENSFFIPLPETDNQTWCGGSGNMLAFDTEGLAYPCLRYMEMSLNGEQKPLIIGDCYRGIYQDPCEKKLLKELKGVNRRTQNMDECYYCPIARGCASCTAWDYQSSGSLYKRSTNICWMHKARSLANVYYWNKLYRLQGLNDKRMKMYLPKDDALQIVTESVYNELESLAE